MDEELIWQASMLEKQSQEIESNLDIITRQMLELEEFSNNILELSKSNSKEIIASIGKGVFIKTDIKEKDLYVDVGSNVIVKKTPEETIKIIESQLTKLQEAKMQLTIQMEVYNNALKNIVQQVEESRSKN